VQVQEYKSEEYSYTLEGETVSMERYVQVVTTCLAQKQNSKFYWVDFVLVNNERIARIMFLEVVGTYELFRYFIVVNGAEQRKSQKEFYIAFFDANKGKITPEQKQEFWKNRPSTPAVDDGSGKN